MSDGPVFILGNHRSGTTWVHELLAETGQVDYLTTADVVGLDRGLDDAAARRAVAAELARVGQTRRAFDEVALSPDAPDEYCQVLTNACGATRGRIDPATLGVFEQMCARVRARSGGRRPLVLKSPWDYPNFLEVSRLVPDARFVFVHRHPERVVHSSLHLARTLAAARDPYFALISRVYTAVWERPWLVAGTRFLGGERFQVGVRLAVLQVAAANRYYVRYVGSLPEERVLILRYEDLCAEPDVWRRRLLTFFAVEGAPGRVTPPRPRGGPLLPEVVRWRPVIARVMAPYMAAHGYRPGGA